jgi:2-polyprenyl-3-methyl-5-hydroxy-6-metoxy-1,4-benzoquinol methylase
MEAHRMTHAFSGSGPGIQTPDGCSVDLYRVLPYMGELDDIQPALRTHSAALELGCGNGRLCKRMMALGFRVTGVDESPQMLAHLPPGVEGVLSSIEELSLGRRWPVVLLASHLINHPDEGVRSAFIAAAKRHTSMGGTFFVKRHNPAWLATVQSGLIGESGGVRYCAEEVARDGHQVRITLRYEVSGQKWTQSFSTTSLSEAEVEDQLRQHGFAQFEWLGAKRLWVSATASDF